MELKIENLSAGYDSKMVIRDISFTALPGKVTGIVGPNGVGKTTLLKCIARLGRPQAGRILANGKDIFSVDKKDLAKIQAYVPQKSRLLFPMTVEDFVTLGRRPYVSWSLTSHDKDVVKDVLHYLAIEHLRTCYVNEISGGEYQKAMLARALVQEPSILLLDEPTSALDIRHQINVMKILRKIAREKYCVVLLVMHDLSLVARFTDQSAFMRNRHLEAFGDTSAVMTEEMIQTVFGVKVKLLNTEYGPTIIPLEESNPCTTE